MVLNMLQMIFDGILAGGLGGAWCDSTRPSAFHYRDVVDWRGYFCARYGRVLMLRAYQPPSVFWSCPTNASGGAS